MDLEVVQVSRIAPDSRIAALLSGVKWAGPEAGGVLSLRYSFAEAGTPPGFADDFTQAVMPFSPAERAATRELLQAIQDVCGLKFVEVPDGADWLSFGYSQRVADLGIPGYSFYPALGGEGGHIWLAPWIADPIWSSYRPFLVLHEALHALGLKHPFADAPVLPTADDTMANTVMSYSAVAGYKAGAMSSYPVAPMVLDVAALQLLYGAAPSHAGDDVYDLSQPRFQSGFTTLWDADGKDTLDAHALAQPVRIDLAPGHWSDVGAVVQAFGYAGEGATRTVARASYTDTLAIAAGVTIENATGTAFDDVLAGNDAANRLDGGAGDDVLAGHDVAVFAGEYAGYRIPPSGGGLLVADVRGGTGTDRLWDIERLRFDDLCVVTGMRELAQAAPAGRVDFLLRLYVAFFGRVADADGMAFWLGRMAAGEGEREVASAFDAGGLALPDVFAYPAAGDDAGFVRAVYRHVLDRAQPDAEGLAFWLDAMAGAHGAALSRADVVLGILQCLDAARGTPAWAAVEERLARECELGRHLAIERGVAWDDPQVAFRKGLMLAEAASWMDPASALQLVGIPPGPPPPPVHWV